MQRNGWFLAGLTFCCLVVYVPWWDDGVIGPRWAFLAAILPFAVLFVREWNLPIGLCGLLFWSIASFCWANQQLQAVYGFVQLDCWIFAFLLASQVEDLTWVWRMASLALVPSAALAVLDVLGWHLFPEAAPPGGLFSNRTVLGDVAVLATVGAFFGAQRPRDALWALPAALALGLAQSKGAYLALMMVTAGWLWQHWRGGALCMIGGMLAAFFVAVAVPGASTSLDERLAIWGDSVSNATWLGHGIGQFYNDFPLDAALQDTSVSRPDHAHNDLVELFYEFGPIGVAFLAIFLAQLEYSRRTPETFVLAAFVVSGFFSFPLHLPASALLSAIAAGGLWRRRIVLGTSKPARGSFTHAVFEKLRPAFGMDAGD